MFSPNDAPMEKHKPNRALMSSQNPYGIPWANRIINGGQIGKHSASGAPVNKQNLNVALVDKEKASGAPICANRILVLHQLFAI